MYSQNKSKENRTIGIFALVSFEITSFYTVVFLSTVRKAQVTKIFKTKGARVTNFLKYTHDIVNM